ncbi:MAG: c-type cytochrome [Pseudomonadota bacterium]
MKRLILIPAVALGLASSPALAAGYASGELLGQNCAACHGSDGREFHEAMPPLAGMDRQNFITAMNAFKQGERPAIVMDRIAKAFSDEEITAMADFFAAQPTEQYGQEVTQ